MAIKQVKERITPFVPSASGLVAQEPVVVKLQNPEVVHASAVVASDLHVLAAVALQA